jgi:transposase
MALAPFLTGALLAMCPSSLPMPAWSAAVLIRSLSTLRCDPSQSWRSGSIQAGTDRNTHREVPATMLAELVDHVVGVDPDRDWITVALLEARTSGVLATERFAATGDGYRDAVLWADARSVASERAWVVEGTASYGRGLTMMLQRRGEWVLEFDRAERKATKDGAKSDALDAVRAGREALGRKRLAEPRAHTGVREAIRVHSVTRAAAVRAHTAAINELKALVVTSDEELRRELRGLRTEHLVARCARFREIVARDVDQRCTRAAMRALARRIQHLDGEVADHDRALKQLLDEAAPQLIAERGIGYVTAAAFYLAWSHPGRCRNEAAYARLAGSAPIEATSGQSQNRHRLNRGGDRQLNRALYLVAITRQRCCPTTKAYIARRTGEGMTEREAIRCIKRFIARRVWRLLEHPRITP